jgi:DNA helicase-2/ATP-dependent DNA helicase PcrA
MIPPQAIAAAQETQRQAAHDPAARIRLIAGPGTGKSSAIEQRVCWLLEQGAPAARICAVSFTRSSVRDLQQRIRARCQQQGHAAAANDVRVSTLHSLALRTLRRAGLLQRYPADPLVLDNWELSTIFDAEFGVNSGITSKRRREEIRGFHEAFWSTGTWNPPNYIPPDPPITPREDAAFTAFHGPRTQAYSCVLPGEIIRQCVEEMRAGNLNPVALLSIEHLIVDEFQDLNPMDQAFIDALAALGPTIFIAGDDDQSIYSFRFASPSGIQTFPNRHQGTTTHPLVECFRCMPDILSTAGALLAQYGAPGRVPKNIQSLYRFATPAPTGIVQRWRFGTGNSEARAIAESCRDLIQAGTTARNILILLCNQTALGPAIGAALQACNVEFERANEDRFLDSMTGRLVLAMLRVVSDTTDHVAHRCILGLRTGVGVRTLDQICQAVIQGNLNFRQVFYDALPRSAFNARGRAALAGARAICGQITAWQPVDTIGQRSAEIGQIIAAALGNNGVQEWQQFVAPLPPDMTLKELRDLIWAENLEQRVHVMEEAYARLGQAVPPAQTLPDRLRIMTMHGAKGLSAQIVFIPGLEDALTPGPWRAPYPGLVLEAARLLYVSITRARAACYLSYANRRFINGRSQTHIPSRYTTHLAGPFTNRGSGLTAPELQLLIHECHSI